MFFWGGRACFLGGLELEFLGIRAWGFGVGVWGLGCRVEGSGLTVAADDAPTHEKDNREELFREAYAPDEATDVTGTGPCSASVETAKPDRLAASPASARVMAGCAGMTCVWGFEVWGLGSGVLGLGFGVWGFGFRVSGVGFWVWGAGRRVGLGMVTTEVALPACTPSSTTGTLITPALRCRFQVSGFMVYGSGFRV